MTGWVPKWIDKVNFVVNFMSNSCHSQWYLYFELAKEPAGKAIIALLSFGFDDIIRGYFRPKNLRAMRHFRRGGKRPPRRPGIPEIGEMIGRHLPGARAARGRHVTQGVKNLWIVDGVLQRVFFWWMIVDITTDFFVEWFSNIQRENVGRWCAQAGFAAHSQNISIIGVAGWQTGLMGQIQWTQPPATWNGFSGQVPDGNFNVVYAIKARPTALVGAAQIFIRIRVTGADAHLSETAQTDLTAGADADCIASTSVVGPATITCEIGTFSGNAITTTQDIFCQGGN